ncbi:hypothetical protein COCOBI_07-1750 [Coccomyxa sp. Obi]|nr:hypothetical protein COCOBI_07-1750 [Coccomyxa sp. Obi]
MRRQLPFSPKLAICLPSPAGPWIANVAGAFSVISPGATGWRPVLNGEGQLLPSQRDSRKNMCQRKPGRDRYYEMEDHIKVLQHTLDVTSRHDPGFDWNNSHSARPILLESSKSLRAALRMCPLLRTIQWRPPQIGIISVLDCTIPLRVSGCLHLTHLSLIHCPLVPGTLSLLGQSSRSLKVLSLQRSYMKFTSVGIFEEAWEGFPQLQCLDLSWFGGVSSNNLRLLTPQLLSLSLHGTRSMYPPYLGCEKGDDSILCRHLRSCVCLDICEAGLCDRDILSLIKAAPELRTVFIRAHSRPSADPWTEGAFSEFQRERPDVVVREIPSPLTPSEYERLGTRPSTS